jgi:hypothetical protein
MEDSISIKYLGDKVRAQSLIGLAKTQLLILKNAMSFQNLEQGRRVLSLDDGSVIVCQSVFGINSINMFTPVLGGVEVQEEKKYKQEYTVIVVFIFTLTTGPGTLEGGLKGTELPKKSVLVWDTRNRSVKVGSNENAACDYDDADFQKWYLGRTFDDSESMFGDIYTNDENYPHRIDPDLIDTTSTVYHSDGTTPGLIIFEESVYGDVVTDMQIVVDGIPTSEFIGLRTEKTEVSDSYTRIHSMDAYAEEASGEPPYTWTITEQYYGLLPEDKNSVDTTGWTEEPGGPLVVDRVATVVRSRFGPDTPTYRVYASDGSVGDARHYRHTSTCDYKCYSKFGLLFEFSKYNNSELWHGGVGSATEAFPQKETKVVIPDWDNTGYPPYTGGVWSDLKKAAYAFSRYGSALYGQYMPNAIVDLYVLQYVPLEYGSYSYTNWQTGEVTLNKEEWNFDPRVTIVHAQAKHTRSNSKNFKWVEEGRNSKLETFLIEAINYVYTLNSIADTETRGLSVEIKMFKKRLPEEEVHE